jgi:hypothetical protein
MFGDHSTPRESAMPSRKIKEPTVRPPVLPKEHDQDQKQRPPGGWTDTDGLCGEGADSAMEHLRMFEQQRRDKAAKGGR